MTESRYYDTENRAEKVRALFTRIASRYGVMNDLMSFGLHRRWKQKVVGAICDRPIAISPAGEGCSPLQTLDVCCGTGDLTLGLAARGARVVGLDFTPAMLSIAQSRCNTASFPGSIAPTLIRGDALQLPFASETFDAVTIGFGLRNLADFEGGLREMVRVIKPGGRVVILDFGLPDNRLWRLIYWRFLRMAVPLLGLLVVGDRQAYRYIPASLERYPAQHGIAKLMSQVGFADVRIVNFLGGVSSIHVGDRKPNVS